jgi:ABC-type antimicrobial peptide transport system permease subunit
LNLRESIVDGLTDVRSHKLRTLLQTLGVVLGVASLVAVQGLVDAGRRQTMNFWSQTGGLTKILVVNRPPKTTTVTARQLASRGLTFEDAVALRSEVPAARLVDPIASTEVIVRHGDYHELRDISAVTPDYEHVYFFPAARGRFITSDDLASKARVVVLGDTAARLYFGSEDPLNQTLYLGDEAFTVIGVMLRKEFYFRDGDGNALEWMNRQTFIPITALYSRFTGDANQPIEYVNVVVDSVEHNREAAEATRAVLKRRHGGVVDFEVINRGDRLARAEEQGKTFDITFLVTGIVSLLVGGIVIMNIMLASFQERIREVGVRKAIGAGSGEIALQFLVESVLVTCIGGAAGLALGIGFAKGISLLLSQPAIITPKMALVGVVASVVTGLVFGMYPAWKAARLNPVEALRYE